MDKPKPLRKVIEELTERWMRMPEQQARRRWSIYANMASYTLCVEVKPRQLTRPQVAERIGRSISCVRKLEGTVLHPEVGPRGIRYFDLTEVDALAAAVRSTGRALPKGARAWATGRKQ